MRGFKVWLARLQKDVSKWQQLQWLVVGVVAIGAFFRLFNLAESLQFLGDQGRDVLIVARIFKELDPVFIGPVTSVGNMYLGPLYYYFMLPWLWLTYPSPLGPQYAIAVLGIITNWLVWVLGKRMVGEKAAAIATVLYAFSHTVVEYTRFSWNPNPIPLVSLLMVYSVFRAWQGVRWHWVLVGLYGSILLQLHYMAALTGVAALIVWFMQMYAERANHAALLSMLRYALYAASILALSFVPLLLFDYKNGWINMNAFAELISGSENFGSTVTSSPLAQFIQPFKESHGRGMHILFEIFIGQQRELNTALLIVYGVVLLYSLSGKRRIAALNRSPGIGVLLVWLLVGIVGTSVYKHTVFDHYIGFEYPVAVLISGFVLLKILRLHKVFLVVLSVALAGYIAYNVPRMPLSDAGWSIYDMQQVSTAIAQRVSAEEQYNIVLFSHSKDLYGMNYRYFLETTDTKLVRDTNWTEATTLFVIDEERSGRNVLAAPVHELLSFPSKQPTEIFAVGKTQIFKLEAR